MAYAIVTFTEVADAIECYNKAKTLKFDHGNGAMHWACAKWYKSKDNGGQGQGGAGEGGRGRLAQGWVQLQQRS